MATIYGPPPGKRRPRKRRRVEPGRARSVLGVLGTITALGLCLFALVWLEVDMDDSDTIDFDRLPTLPLYDHAEMFRAMDASVFRPMQVAGVIPSSAIHPAPAVAAGQPRTRSRRNVTKPLQSAGIIGR